MWPIDALENTKRNVTEYNDAAQNNKLNLRYFKRADF